MRSQVQRRRTANWLLLLAFVAVCVAGVASIASRIHGQPTAVPPVLAETTVQSNEGPPINWDMPIGAAVEVTKPGDATAYLTFTPIVPRALPVPLRLLASQPANTIAWIYQDPMMGRFILLETRTQWTQAQLESLAGWT